MHHVSRLACAVAAGALTFAAASSSAIGATLPRNINSIVTQQAINGNVGLTVYDSNTHKVYPLTGIRSTGTSDDWTSWAPGGARIAFIRKGSNSSDVNDINGSGLYIYNMNLQREFRMTTGLKDPALPTWGSASQLAFVAQSQFVMGPNPWGVPEDELVDRACVYLYTNLPDRNLKKLFCPDPGYRYYRNTEFIQLSWSSDKRHLIATNSLQTGGLDPLFSTRIFKIDVQTGNAEELQQIDKPADWQYYAPPADRSVVAPDAKDAYLSYYGNQVDWASLVNGDYVEKRYAFVDPVYSGNSSKLAGAALTKDSNNTVTKTRIAVSNRDTSGTILLGSFSGNARPIEWRYGNGAIAVRVDGAPDAVLSVANGIQKPIPANLTIGNGQIWYRPSR